MKNRFLAICLLFVLTCCYMTNCLAFNHIDSETASRILNYMCSNAFKSESVLNNVAVYFTTFCGVPADSEISIEVRNIYLNPISDSYGEFTIYAYASSSGVDVILVFPLTYTISENGISTGISGSIEIIMPDNIENKKYNGDGILLNDLDERKCYSIAEDYLTNLDWKNPHSLQIHGYVVTYQCDSFLFAFDYSAQNGLGGYNRGTYYICVDFNTGEVVDSYSL